MYQQINLADHSLVGDPGPVPKRLVGLTDDILADLGAAIDPPPVGFEGQGFWPVLVTTPAFDPLGQVVVSPGRDALTVDIAARTVTGTATLRDMTADELAAANPVPAEVSRAQGRIQLLRMGLLDFMEGKVNASPDGELKIWWADAAAWKRTSAYIAALAAAVPLTGAQVDAAFVAAGKIEA